MSQPLFRGITGHLEMGWSPNPFLSVTVSFLYSLFVDHSFIIDLYFVTMEVRKAEGRRAEPYANDELNNIGPPIRPIGGDAHVLISIIEENVRLKAENALLKATIANPKHNVAETLKRYY